MEVGPPTSDASDKFFFCLRFADSEWHIIKVATNARSEWRQSQALEPFIFDQDLHNWDPNEDLNCAADYPDVVCRLLRDYHERTRKDMRALPISSRLARQVMGDQAIGLARQLWTEAIVSTQIRYLDDELVTLLDSHNQD